jgi:predicted dehydrogenase
MPVAEKLRWLVVGVGDISTRRVIPAIQTEPRSLLSSVVTSDPAKAEPYGCRRWQALEEALAAESFDAVYVATPVFRHAPQTIAALRAGCHVLCEKPMALHYREAVSMVDAAHENGRTLGIAYYRRMYPKVRRAMELIAAGAIGRPVLAEINCHGWFQDEDGRRSWLLDPAKAGGGPLYDIGSHRIDLLNFFFGTPARATGQMSKVVHRSAVEDSATVLIEYESGVRGVVDVRWHSRIDRDEFRIVGTDGSLVLSPLNSPRLETPEGAEEWPVHANIHYPCIENFVDAVEGKATLASSGESSVWTDWVTEQVTSAQR